MRESPAFSIDSAAPTSDCALTSARCGGCVDACVKEAATPEQLEHARELFWQHLEGNDCPLQRQTRPGKPGKQTEPLEQQEWGKRWDRNDCTTWREGHGDGLMTSTTHCDAMWYVRTLPGVCGAFAAACKYTPQSHHLISKDVDGSKSVSRLSCP